MNALLLRRWLREEGPALIGARLRGPRQLDAKSIVLEFSGEQGRIDLLLSVLEGCPTLAVVPPVGTGRAPSARDDETSDDASRAAARPSTESPSGGRADAMHGVPAEESGFVKALRYQLSGHTLIAIEQGGFERSVSFRFHHRDNYGRDTLRQLVVELAGRASNAYLISERGMVVSLLKRIPPGSNRVRSVRSGKPLPPPPPLGKFVAGEQDSAALESELAALAADTDNAAAQANPLRELLTRRVAGGEVKLWPALEPLLPVQHGVDELYNFIRELQAGELTDTLFGLHAPGDANCAALAAWETANVGAQGRAPVGKAESANRQQREELLKRLVLTGRADELEALGLALMAEAERLDGNGTAMPFLVQWQQDNHDWAEHVDPLASVADNAQQLVNLAQRFRRGHGKLVERLADLSRGAAAQRPPSAQTGGQRALHSSAPMQELSAKLERRGVKHLRFTSSDGMLILCGQSDASNDGLLRHFGNARHLWLHARDFPGSHVLILSNGADVPRRTLEEAASIAAYYSKGQKDHEVEVSYVPMKHVRKPKGAKPGLVHISNEKVISVRPDRFEEWRGHLLRRTD